MKNYERIVEIASILNKYEKSDWDLLESVSSDTTQWLDDLVTDFFKTLFQLEDATKIFFAEHEEIVYDNKDAAWYQIIFNWLNEIISGTPQENFWQNMWVVGLVHVSHSINPSFQLNMMSVLQQSFRKKCLSNFELEKALEISEAFTRITNTCSACIVEANIFGLITGMMKVGMNENLIKNIKTSAVKKIIKEERASVKKG